MEELQDAIEDAQYVSAISSVEDGPRPVLPWEIPEESDIASWKTKVLSKHEDAKKIGGDGDGNGPEDDKFSLPPPFEFEWTLAQTLGFFLFSTYMKEGVGKHVEINFMEEVIRWRATRGRIRAERTSYILQNYLVPLSAEDLALMKAEETASLEKAANPVSTENGHLSNKTSENTSESDGAKSGQSKDSLEGKRKQPKKEELGPPKTEITEYDMVRDPPCFDEEDMEECRESNSSDPTKMTCVGVGGQVLDAILNKVEKLRKSEGYTSIHEVMEEEEERERDDIFDNDFNALVSFKKTSSRRDSMDKEKSAAKMRSLRNMSLVTHEIPENLFDYAEALVAENLKKKYWAGFQKSEQHVKLLNFLWFQDRKVVEEDFFVMRVLGRGGFGLVTACKKGTSGKLYAMKVMNKKRIKIKKAEQLTLNEQKCLADINSPFVVNLKYSFQSKTDVFLILDLMTGGDLSFHLAQKGLFPKSECLYYGARIMLGLQALHDHGYVYRDLKPENCLLGDDGRVKLTDLGLATKVTKNLHGAAGTRGYWAPEMLRRDSNGKRLNYGHMVDWFSFGCCLAEFISGTNPFRSEAALNFGLEKGKKSKVSKSTTKEKAIDCATLEMQPVFDGDKFSEEAADILRLLLDKNEKTRLGATGCREIMKHPYFKSVNWEEILTDRMRPPYRPPKDVNAASQSEIGTFAEDKTFQECVLSDKDDAVYDYWNYTNPKAFSAEVIEFLIYERDTGQPLLPIQPNASCCCTII